MTNVPLITVTEIRGLAELRTTLLKYFPQELQGPVLQAALAKAALPIVQMARSLAPKRTGRLKAAIFSTRDKKRSTKERESRVVTVKHGKKYGKQDAYYWKFIEFGHYTVKPGGRKKFRRHRRSSPETLKGSYHFIPATPFMQPAILAQSGAAMRAFIMALKPAMAKISARAVSRSARGVGRSITGLFG